MERTYTSSFWAFIFIEVSITHLTVGYRKLKLGKLIVKDTIISYIARGSSDIDLIQILTPISALMFSQFFIVPSVRNPE